MILLWNEEIILYNFIDIVTLLVFLIWSLELRLMTNLWRFSEEFWLLTINRNVLFKLYSS